MAMTFINNHKRNYFVNVSRIQQQHQLFPDNKDNDDGPIHKRRRLTGPWQSDENSRNMDIEIVSTSSNDDKMEIDVSTEDIVDEIFHATNNPSFRNIIHSCSIRGICLSAELRTKITKLISNYWD
mmetsp:Transcript_7866/g.9024  ORF Transcript_7866/g.9024 Transcript_7866/m.9024 type:complete len:125 (+) Transcript_7866:152-526(+)|eukprot:CAMPEP_0194191204 /NCGR_PEP_ID=MMETSP0154-20130528/65923_1 /TAXON_ID=1049557 /ORGANISM="Thalassiothrix antarctica, Strain L6-D1" /LENGTH=124 /DNA_ID=CAMNT_0038913697 /DNA_START=47 /DNA_END=421 /DNA_ORIENTATION=+